MPVNNCNVLANNVIEPENNFVDQSDISSISLFNVSQSVSDIGDGSAEFNVSTVCNEKEKNGTRSEFSKIPT